MVKKGKKELRPYQKEAIESVIKGFQSNDRGKLIMPPGTGKTLVSLRIAESFGKGSLILFLCPSIALLDQSIKAWRGDSGIPINLYAVVSDVDAGKDELNTISLLSIPPTTSAEKLAKEFKLKEDKLNVIFSTYQSLDAIKEAQTLGLPEFDLIICDEAHRTAGVSKKNKKSNFKLIHSNDNIKGKKRLYMTATPKVFDVKNVERKKTEDDSFVEVYDMNDERIFGSIFFEYSFKEAIDQGYLSNYQVIVMEMDRNEVQRELFQYLMQSGLTVDDAVKIVGLGKLIRGDIEDEDGNFLNITIKSGIVFVNTVLKSKKISKDFQDVFQRYFKDSSPVEVKHIDGNMPVSEKRSRIGWLKVKDDSKVHILTNAKVLTEGIDIPALDFVAFLDPKESVVDVIQAVGRVVRKVEGKEFGVIFIPIILDMENGSIDQQVEKKSYKTVWQVIGALASLDSDFQFRIRHILMDNGKSVDCKRSAKERSVVFSKGNIKKRELCESIRKYISAKIVKSFRLGSIFLKDWAVETAKIAKDLKNQIQIALEKDQSFRQKFEELRDVLFTILNEGIEEQDTIDFIVQYILTKPIFDAVFEHKDKADEILDNIFEYFKHFLENNIKELDKFYEEVPNKAKGLRDEEERQEFLRYLYTNFFNVAFKEKVDESGIAYTPAALVSFTTKFVNYLTQKHFGKKLDDKGVVLFEPFAGTGTFINLAIENMDPRKLEEKLQRKEIWANEILLLPYMVMIKNIETVISKKTGKFIPFETALWTDSFALVEKFYERKTSGLLTGSSIVVAENFKEMVEKQLNAKVNVIISNPPWKTGEEGENRGRIIEYKNLRKRIEQTYVKYAKELGTTNINSLYDMYIQALRMASDRVEDGIIGFVLNNGWLKGLPGRGIRKALSEEFAEVYVYDLKGDVNARSKKEGKNVFPVKVGNCLLFLVKKKDKKEPAKIFYKAVKDYAKKEEKLAELKEWEEKVDQISWQEIVPNDKHDWIDQGDEKFESFVKLRIKKNEREIPLFNRYSSGLNTSRDAYVYNFSRSELRKNIMKLIDLFNECLEGVQCGEITKENVNEKECIKKMKWDNTLKSWLFKLTEKQEYKEDKVFSVFYRPFVPMQVYFDKVFNNTVSYLSFIFPTPDAENLVIVVMSPGKGGEFSAAIADRIVDVHYMPQTVIFPLYTYTTENKLFGKTIQKKWNITDQMLKKFQESLNDNGIRKEDIFYYIFGALSTPLYVEKFKNNLSKELPRVPLLNNFKEISQFGKQLAELQLAYGRYVSAVVMKEKEKLNLPEYSGLNIVKTSDSDLDDYVEKVKLDKKNREIVVNGKVRVQNIPEFALECRVGNYSPIEWISKYLVKQEDKDTGITWDPKIKISEFVDIMKKLIAFSENCLEIKENLNKCYSGSPTL